ncbi:hypothetical protein ACER1F_003637 [Vibrio alginolyticus]
MLDERTEILAARDRAMAGTEVMRKKRNEAAAITAELREENERTTNALSLSCVTLNKDEVFAYFNRRKEQEILVVQGLI